MADNAVEDILLFGLIGGLGYWLYTTLFAAPSPTSVPATSSGAPSAPSASGGVTASPSYSGPTLDQMYAALLQQEQAAMEASVPDPALSCSDGGTPGSVSGVNSTNVNTRGLTTVNTTPVNPGLLIQTNPLATRTVTGVPTGTVPTGFSGFRRGMGQTLCGSPTATYDVHNWYLVNRANVGVSNAPSPPGHTTQVTIQQYWTWAAPLLQQQMPGLSGIRGLGHFGAIGQICRRAR